MSDAATTEPGTLRQSGEPLPWRRGLVWLLFLGPFFFGSYGFANWWASTLAQPGAVVFDWERHIPFLPWTIVPYWSIDLLYGLSFLLCRSRLETDRHALRLLTAQLISVTCFLLFPLRFTFERPETGGLFGSLFDLLMGFDKPFNQAPSLHISLLLILWVRYAGVTRGFGRLAVHAWAFLIGVSVLTTYQHHFFDVPTGLLAGAFCLWLWPDAGPSPLSGLKPAACPVRRRLAAAYLLGAVAGALASLPGGAALWLLWPTASLLLVAANYGLIGARGFQKSGDRLSWGAALILLPYTLGAWLNSRWWPRRRPGPDEIADGVWLGRLPTREEMARGGFAAIIDLTAELPGPRGDWHYAGQPWLDLVPPDDRQLAQAAREIEELRPRGPVLVCCALGYSRSASAVAAWLLHTGRVDSADEAIAYIAARRPGVVLGARHRASLSALGARHG